MKKRYLYMLLYGIPGFGVALILAFVIFAAASGVLWLYIFGDEPWPPATGIVLPLLFALFFFLLWGFILAWGFAVGRSLEATPVVNGLHLLWSVLATLGLALLIALQLGGVNRGGPVDSLACSDYCRQQGFAASGLTPRNAEERICSCYDAAGREAGSIKLDELLAGRQE